MKKVIAFILPTLNVGGAERVTLSIIKRLDTERYTPVLITMNAEGPLRSELPSYVHTYVVESTRLRYSVLKLIKLIKHIQPACIFSTLRYVNFVILMLKKLLGLNAKIIIRESSTVSMVLKQMPAYKAKIYTILYKRLYPKADLIIAQCNNMREDFIRLFHINPQKIIRIYNPVDINTVVSKSEEFIPWEFIKGELNIVAVGRLVELKGYDVLLKAFSILIKYKPQAHLYIIGDGPLRTKLMSLCKSLGLNQQVTFTGFISNPYPYISHCDLYVLSSKWEGFPNALLEALVLGAKVVATACESGPAEVLGDEEYGLLAKVCDEQSLCEKMLQYIDMESKTGDRGKYFSIDRIYSQYQKAFDSVLS